MRTIRKIFAETFYASQPDPLTAETQRFDWKTVIILVWAALGLSIIRYYGDYLFTAGILADLGADELSEKMTSWSHDKNAQLYRLGWWVGVMIFVYFFVPAMIIRFIFRERLSAYGFGIKNSLRGWPLYVIMLAIMIPLVVYFSSTASFKARYPFYDPKADGSLWPNFWLWEAMYLGQFVALEFFFRGFMTIGLRPRFGYYSIFVMTIPYCMIHFGKPMPETIGAIIAGIVLGTLSLKSRSIWLGIFIHYSIAITMDLCALWRKDLF
jgi:membrane protease YdiL (CAAX protease family)